MEVDCYIWSLSRLTSKYDGIQVKIALELVKTEKMIYTLYKGL